MKGVKRWIAAAALLADVSLLQSPVAPVVAAQSDLDAFMQQVVARRDDNWRKLQQYILDEREEIEVRGPAHISLWGERREYTWYIRDGFFVRSPLKVNGVAISEADRRKYEAEYLQRVKRRDERRADLIRSAPPTSTSAGQPQDTPAPRTTEPPNTETPLPEAPTDVAGLIRQSRQPEFISSAYFLRFKFDAGTYALVGRERLENREVLRIEYYPTNLFSNRREGREGRGGQGGREGRRGQAGQEKQDQEDALFNRLMNKVALVTLWVEPTSHQIVKYNYDNVALEFLPAQWLVHVDDVRASMTMGQPFPDVWLPRGLEMNAALTFALGPVEFRYALDYHDYRQADATVKVR
jgi:hypothetical protein